MRSMRTAAGLSLIAAMALTATGAIAAPATQSPDTPACLSNTDLLGLSRIVEIDASASPRFGDQYPRQEFLKDREVVLTFDDGPMRRYTVPILKALEAQCTKATFFAVGRMAISDPVMLREIAKRGHTIGTHTWSHKKLSHTTSASAKREIELGLSAVAKAAGVPVAPFFRFPYLGHSKSTLAYVGRRNMATFGINIDSRDFRTRRASSVLRTVMSQLERRKKGILLFHDIQPSTAGAIVSVLAELKKRNFKVVHVVAKTPAKTLPKYDAIAERMLKKKKIAADDNPMVKRAATWPVSGTGDKEKKASTGATATAKAKRRRVRKTNWNNLANDPWQLQSHGTNGAP
jgi:peptidoglycan-N-acetylglucosamine deacetylase